MQTTIVMGIFLVGIIAAIVLMRGPNPRYIINYIKKEQANGNVAMRIQFEGDDYANVNADRPLPLASTVKWLVAIAFAEQVAAGKLSLDRQIPITALERYYLPKVDGGAHSAWMEQLEGVVVTLEEVAQGMIRYSSNANTDYLIDLIGLDVINALPERLGMTHQTTIYPLGASLYFPYVYMKEHKLTAQQCALKLRAMPEGEYVAGILAAHEQLTVRTLTTAERKDVVERLPLAVQHVWSDRLPKASANDYVHLMQILNERAFFSDEMYDVLDTLSDTAKVNPRRYKQYAEKGGSTAWIMTLAMYATKVNDAQLQLVFLANCDDMHRQKKLQRTIHRFIGKFITDARFREQVAEQLSKD